MQEQYLIIPLTKDELKELISEVVTEVLKENLPEQSSKSLKDDKIPLYIYGMKELASFLHCSISSAQRKFSAGEFDGASFRTGQIIGFNTEKLFEILTTKPKLTRKFRKTK